MQDLIDYIARALTESPEQISVQADGSDKVLLSVAPDDLGRIIGRRGRTAKAIRTLLRAAYGADLEILEGEDDEPSEAEE